MLKYELNSVVPKLEDAYVYTAKLMHGDGDFYEDISWELPDAHLVELLDYGIRDLQSKEHEPFSGDNDALRYLARYYLAVDYYMDGEDPSDGGTYLHEEIYKEWIADVIPWDSTSNFNRRAQFIDSNRFTVTIQTRDEEEADNDSL